MAKGKEEVISVRFPKGTGKEIKRISKELYYGRSISDYVKECVLCNLVHDSNCVKDRELFKTTTEEVATKLIAKENA